MMRMVVWALGVGVGLVAASWAMGLGPRAAEAACSPLPSGKGTVSMSIVTATAASYRVWVRVLAPTTAAKSFYVQIADGSLCQATMGGAALPANTWTWVDYQGGAVANKVNVTLSVASHAVVLAGVDDGLQVDKVLLLSDAACVPAGDGTNCMQESSPTPVSGGSSGTPSPSASPVSNKISIAIPAGIMHATCRIDGKLVDCAAVDTTKLSDGTHTVEIVGTDANGKPVTKTTTIQVKNHRAGWFGWPLAVALATAGLAGVGGGLLYLNRRVGWPSRLWQAAEPVERDSGG